MNPSDSFLLPAKTAYRPSMDGIKLVQEQLAVAAERQRCETLLNLNTKKLLL
jgi:hypothetical protein